MSLLTRTLTRWRRRSRHGLRSMLPAPRTAVLLVGGTLVALNGTPTLARAAPATAGRHALNATTGADKWPPTVLSRSGPGTGAGSSGGTVSLNPKTNRQRVSLLLENGKIYVAFSSFCDIGAYQGWIPAYSYSTAAFTLANAYDDVPNGSDGGIWSGSGAGIAGDPSGIPSAAVHRGRREQRRHHHQLRHRQGQRPAQRNRDPERMTA